MFTWNFKINYVYATVFTANILGMLTGMSTSWSSSSIQKLRKYDVTPDYPFKEPVSEYTLSWISSLLQLGAVFGAVIFGAMSYKLGRKITIACIGVPFIIAYTLLAFATHPYTYMIARTTAGLSVGGTFMVLPTYIGEICDQLNRGRLTSSTTSFTFFGLFLSYCIGPFMNITAYNLIIASIAFVFIPVFLCIAPETPYYYLSTNKFSEALKSFTKLRGYDDRGISKELEYIESNIKKCQEGPITDIFTNTNSLKALFITTGLVSLQQLCGINLILQRNEKLFDISGTELPHKVCPIIVGAVLYVTSYITPVLCDKVGRRLLFFISSSGAFLSLATLGFYFYSKELYDDSTVEIHWMPLLCLVLYICSYNCGLSSLPWAVMGELFPMHIKSVGSAICTSVYWMIGFLMNNYFTPLREDVGMGTAIWIFSGFCFVIIIFVFLFLFETKGKTLEEIQDILQHK